MSRQQIYRKAFQQGAEAKARGYEGVNPYGKLRASAYWHAGYSGLDCEYFMGAVADVRKQLRA
jgi:hypothetical protein